MHLHFTGHIVFFSYLLSSMHGLSWFYQIVLVMLNMLTPFQRQKVKLQLQMLAARRAVSRGREFRHRLWRGFCSNLVNSHVNYVFLIIYYGQVYFNLRLINECANYIRNVIRMPNQKVFINFFQINHWLFLFTWFTVWSNLQLINKEIMNKL